MALSDKVKTALDETRTLILGAQILLGFQYQGVFQQRFDSLPPAAWSLSALSLALMLATVAVLIVPSAFHRLADRDESTGRIQLLAGRCSMLALAPLAVALGIDLSVDIGRALESPSGGIVVGAVFTVLALTGWYGVGMLMKYRTGEQERRMSEPEQGKHGSAPLHARIEQMLVEARVILPGAQAMLGFQLVIVLTETFDKLPETSRILHAVSLVCVALAVMLLITPAALHRIVWAGQDSEPALRIGGFITVLSLIPLALGMAGETYIVFARIFGSPGAGAAAAAVTLLCLLSLWFAWPLLHRRSTRQESARQQVATAE